MLRDPSQIPDGVLASQVYQVFITAILAGWQRCYLPSSVKDFKPHLITVIIIYH